MGKIENLERYINECEKMHSKTDAEKDDFITKTILVYENEIKNITYGLDMYAYLSDGTTIDYSGDLDKVKAKLINYKDNLEVEEQKRKSELELARLKQGNINVSATANNSNNINIQITVEQAIEALERISDDVLTKEEKEELEDKISGIDMAVKSGKKEKAKEKICGVLKFLADKGADALIVMLPYLGQMAGMIQVL